MPLYPPPSGGSGDVATDAIWDAAGDLALGSGADSAAKLTRGTPGQVLLPNATTLEWAANPLYGHGPSGVLFEPFSRYSVMTGAAFSSGTLKVTAAWIPKGVTITSLNIVNGTTAESGGSHAWAALFDSSKNLLRQSTDETGAGAIAASAVHVFTLTSTFVTTYSGLHYVGLCVVASGMPNVQSLNVANALITAVPPILTGNTSDTGLTGTAPSTFGTITAGTTPFYCYGL